ncbi:MAG: hypothetical protein WCV41_00985 [Patescibacteria group bacterium]
MVKETQKVEPEKVVFQIPNSFKGRVLAEDRVKPGTFTITITQPIEEIAGWGEDAILRYSKKIGGWPSITWVSVIEVWHPDPSIPGVFEYAAIVDDKNMFSNVENVWVEGNMVKAKQSISWMQVIGFPLLRICLMVVLCLVSFLVLGWFLEKMKKMET